MSKWWQHAVVYQVYPRSFQDTDGDGIGDLRCILNRLEHLAWLDVDMGFADLSIAHGRLRL